MIKDLHLNKEKSLDSIAGQSETPNKACTLGDVDCSLQTSAKKRMLQIKEEEGQMDVHHTGQIMDFSAKSAAFNEEEEDFQTMNVNHTGQIMDFSAKSAAFTEEEDFQILNVNHTGQAMELGAKSAAFNEELNACDDTNVYGLKKCVVKLVKLDLNHTDKAENSVPTSEMKNSVPKWSNQCVYACIMCLATADKYGTFWRHLKDSHNMLYTKYCELYGDGLAEKVYHECLLF